MKNKLLKHMLVVGGILIILGIADWINYRISGNPVLCIKSQGGDCKIYYGLWYMIIKAYPEVKPGEQGVYIDNYFMPLLGILAFVVITAISMIPFGRKKRTEA